jgi:hypothetical protein
MPSGSFVEHSHEGTCSSTSDVELSSYHVSCRDGCQVKQDDYHPFDKDWRMIHIEDPDLKLEWLPSQYQEKPHLLTSASEREIVTDN